MNFGLSNFELIPGSIFDRDYQIMAPLGSGGMASVFLVRHVAMDKIFALKVLRNATQDRNQILRFQNEAKAIARLEHPHIVKVYNTGICEGIGGGSLAYLVMEVLEGRSLDVVLQSGEGDDCGLDLERALHIIEQVADALGAVHSSGIIHRDIKPANIMLITPPIGYMKGQDFVKILDFGVAKVDRVENQDLTAKGEIVGSPLYMSPEQLLGQAVREQGDVYSLGITFCELVAGKPPYLGRTMADTANMHFSAPPPDLSIYSPGLSYHVKQILARFVARILAKTTDERYKNMVEVKAAIREIIEALEEEREAEEEDRRVFRSGSKNGFIPRPPASHVSGIQDEAETLSPQNRPAVWLALGFALLLVASGIALVGTGIMDLMGGKSEKIGSSNGARVHTNGLDPSFNALPAARDLSVVSQEEAEARLKEHAQEKAEHQALHSKNGVSASSGLDDSLPKGDQAQLAMEGDPYGRIKVFANEGRPRIGSIGIQQFLASNIKLEHVDHCDLYPTHRLLKETLSGAADGIIARLPLSKITWLSLIEAEEEHFKDPEGLKTILTGAIKISKKTPKLTKISTFGWKEIDSNSLRNLLQNANCHKFDITDFDGASFNPRDKSPLPNVRVIAFRDRMLLRKDRPADASFAVLLNYLVPDAKTSIDFNSVRLYRSDLAAAARLNGHVELREPVFIDSPMAKRFKIYGDDADVMTDVDLDRLAGPAMGFLGEEADALVKAKGSQRKQIDESLETMHSTKLPPIAVNKLTYIVRTNEELRRPGWFAMITRYLSTNIKCKILGASCKAFSSREINNFARFADLKELVLWDGVIDPKALGLLKTSKTLTYLELQNCQLRLNDLADLSSERPDLKIAISKNTCKRSGFKPNDERLKKVSIISETIW